MSKLAVQIAGIPATAITGFLGGCAALWFSNSRAAQRLLYLGNALSAGVVTSAGLVHLLNDAVEGFGDTTFPWPFFLAGLSLIFVMAIETIATFTTQRSHGLSSATTLKSSYESNQAQETDTNQKLRKYSNGVSTSFGGDQERVEGAIAITVEQPSVHATEEFVTTGNCYHAWHEEHETFTARALLTLDRRIASCRDYPKQFPQTPYAHILALPICSFHHNGFGSGHRCRLDNNWILCISC